MEEEGGPKARARAASSTTLAGLPLRPSQARRPRPTACLPPPCSITACRPRPPPTCSTAWPPCRPMPSQCHRRAGPDPRSPTLCPPLRVAPSRPWRRTAAAVGRPPLDRRAAEAPPRARGEQGAGGRSWGALGRQEGAGEEEEEEQGLGWDQSRRRLSRGPCRPPSCHKGSTASRHNRLRCPCHHISPASSSFSRRITITTLRAPRWYIIIMGLPEGAKQGACTGKEATGRRQHSTMGGQGAWEEEGEGQEEGQIGGQSRQHREGVAGTEEARAAREVRRVAPRRRAGRTRTDRPEGPRAAGKRSRASSRRIRAGQEGGRAAGRPLPAAASSSSSRTAPRRGRVAASKRWSRWR